MKLQRPNLYAGKCCVCGERVAEHAGFLVPGADAINVALRVKKWLTVCASRKCATAVVGAEEVALADARELRADGTIEITESPEVLPLLDAIAVKGDGGVWRATLRHRDRGSLFLVARLLGLRVAPELFDFDDPPKVRLAIERARKAGARDYQLDGVRWGAYLGLRDGEHEVEALAKDKRFGGVCGDDPGLGKTFQALFFLHDDEAMVVACPANVKDVWPREAAKWRPDRFDEFVICEGLDGFVWPANPRVLVVINYDVLPPTPAQIRDERNGLIAKRDGRLPVPASTKKAEREGTQGLVPALADLDEDERELFAEGYASTTAGRYEIYLGRCKQVEVIASIKRIDQALARNAEAKTAGKPKCPVLLVADEAHYVQSNKAQRTVAWRYLVKRARRVVGLTGTSVEHDPLLLWGLLQSCAYNPFTWLGFRYQFSAHDTSWGSVDFVRESSAEGSTAKGPVRVLPGTTEILQTAMLWRRKDDVLAELPPKIYSEIPVPLTPKLIAMLNETTAIVIDYLVRGELPPFELTASTRKALAIASIPTMLAEVDNYEQAGLPLIVFSDHRDPIAKLSKRKGWATITGAGATANGAKAERGRTVDRFQAGDFRGIGGTIAMAEGITLTHASTTLVVDPFWNYSKAKQAADRSHRLGQEATVHIVRLVPDHPLARHMAAVLQSKAEFTASVLDGAGQFVTPPSRFTDDAGPTPAAAPASLEIVKPTLETLHPDGGSDSLAELIAIASAPVTPAQSEARAKRRVEARRPDPDAPDNAPCLDAAPAPVLAPVSRAQLQAALLRATSQALAPVDAALLAWLTPGASAGKKHATAAAVEVLRRYGLI